MANPFKLLVLPGDGIGPEVVAVGLSVFERLCQLEGIDTEIQHDLLHGAAWEKYGSFCRDETVTTAHQSDAVLIGAVGGPQWDDIVIEGAVEQCLRAGVLTADLGGSASTEQVHEKILSELH